ncbi:hypothetical protein FACS1894147_02550 [Spirochaetia bacterium]|nr:hypothetical protein FACS1894147_02550 [Spirochaetia bacterium]
MALDESALASALETIFEAMSAASSGMPKDNKWYAAEMAKAITDQIKTADVNPGIDVTGGTQTGGSLVGAKTAAKGTLS